VRSFFGMVGVESLREELDAIARDLAPDLLDRSVRVIGVLDEALRPLNVSPVLVGGMAVLFWTSDEAFATRDIDLVMDEPPEADEVLRALGFKLAPDHRHWELPNRDVLIELPSRHLPDGATVEVVRLDGGRSVRVLSKVDVAIVRLEELAIGPRDDITLQALALINRVEQSERPRLHERARQVNVADLLNRLLPVADEVATGTRSLPEHDELYELVKGS
jgi:hypothetical protein